MCKIITNRFYQNDFHDFRKGPFVHKISTKNHHACILYRNYLKVKRKIGFF
jgi:hypothetical protein